eukprot:4106734-Pyramimonas_sp.AAC.1
MRHFSESPLKPKQRLSCNIESTRAHVSASASASSLLRLRPAAASSSSPQRHAVASSASRRRAVAMTCAGVDCSSKTLQHPMMPRVHAMQAGDHAAWTGAV